MVTKKLPYEKLNIDIIQVSYTNPRLSAYEGEAFDTLVDTIKEHGVITPLAVNNIDEEYFLIAGERRYRAAKKAGLEHIPCIVHHNLSEEKILKMQVIENTGRVALTSIEEGLAIKNYINKYPEAKKKDVADAFGLERTRAHKALKIVELPEAVWGFISSKKLSDGHAEAITRLIGKVDEAKIIEIATAAALLTVSETRELVSNTLSPKENTLVDKLDKASHRIAAFFDGITTVKHKGKDKVELSVELGNGSKIAIISNTDNLEDTITLLGVAPEDSAFDRELADATEFVPNESEVKYIEEEFARLDIPDMDVANIERFNEVAENKTEASTVFEDVKDKAQTEVEVQVQTDSEKPVTKIELPVILPPNSENNVCIVIDPLKGDPISNKNLMRSLEKLCPSNENLTSKHNIALLILLTRANKLTKKGYCDAVTADSIISKLCANYDYVNVYRNYGTDDVYEL